jgi:regulator of sirC expression with transglutaminase-like and TPR domain
MPFTEENRKDTPPRGPGKLTKTVKETVLAVFNELQQEECEVKLINWAKQQPTEFYKIAAKLIPTEINGVLRKVIHVRMIDGEAPPDAETEVAQLLEYNPPEENEDQL